MPLQRSPSTGTYSSQPNLSTCEDEEPNMRITTRKRKNPEDDQFSEFCRAMKTSFAEFQSKQDKKYENLVKAIEVLTVQNTKLIESNGELGKILQQNLDQQNELKKKICLLEEECTNAHKKIDTLEDQLDQLQRSQLKTILEVRNVPKEEKEDLNKIITNLMNAVNTEVSMDHVSQIYRGGKANAPIVIEFKNFTHKMQLLKSVITYNKVNKTMKLNSKDLGIETSSFPVYVSDKLTPKTKMILAAAKQLVKDGTFKYCWVSKGIVLMRKTEDETPIRIEKLKDLDKYKCSNMSD